MRVQEESNILRGSEPLEAVYRPTMQPTIVCS